MSRILRHETPDDPIVLFGARSLFIGGEEYENTASKFWSGLIDEAIEDYPGCDGIALATTGSLSLSADLLFPVNELQREIDRGEFVSLEDAMRQAEEDLAMFGRPAGVQVVLYAGESKIRGGELPRDCIDANVFGYLMAWLFQWGAIPELMWNDETLGGGITAADLARKLAYRISFAFRNRHLSEGLYDRSVTISFSRGKPG